MAYDTEEDVREQVGKSFTTQASLRVISYINGRLGDSHGDNTFDFISYVSSTNH